MLFERDAAGGGRVSAQEHIPWRKQGTLSGDVVALDFISGADLYAHSHVHIVAF